MDVRVTPIPRFISSTKCKPGTPAIYQQNRSSFNTGRSATKRNVLLASSSPLNKPQTFNTSKRLGADNNLLLLSKKGTSKPRVFLKVTPNINQNNEPSPARSGNKNVLLYQQIERDKLLSNNSELVNRFNYKV